MSNLCNVCKFVMNIVWSSLWPELDNLSEIVLTYRMKYSLDLCSGENFQEPEDFKRRNSFYNCKIYILVFKLPKLYSNTFSKFHLPNFGKLSVNGAA